MDFHGPLPSGLLLVIIDDFSRYPIIKIINHRTAQSVIPVTDKVLAMFSILSVLKSDNSAPFNSSELAKFADHLDFHLHRPSTHRVIPYWSQANGEVQLFMANLSKVVHTTTVDMPWQQCLYTFLMNYRSTPHYTTDQSPAHLLFDRNISLKLPELRPSSHASDSARAADQLQKLKIKSYDNKRRSHHHQATASFQIHSLLSPNTSSGGEDQWHSGDCH